MPTNQLYFMGIIDILTPYDLKKKSEHYWKSMTLDKVWKLDRFFKKKIFPKLVV